MKQEKLFMDKKLTSINSDIEILHNSKNDNKIHNEHIIIIKQLGPDKGLKRILNICDTLIVLFVITPLVVLHWNGTWAIIDKYPQHFTPFNEFLLGCAMHTAFVLIKEILHNAFAIPAETENKSIPKRMQRFFGMKFYAYFFSWGCNMHWRGLWALFDNTIGNDSTIAFIQCFGCTTILILLKSLRNLSAPPFLLIIDSKYMACSYPTRFRIKDGYKPPQTLPLPEYERNKFNKKIYKLLLNILDTILSITIVAPLVVGYWRGTWDLLGHFLLSNQEFISALISFWIGIIGHLLFAFLQQWFERNFNPNKNRLTYYIISRFYTYSFGFICVNGWRGTWMLTDYFSGGSYNLWIVSMITLASVIILILIKTSRNLGASPYSLVTDQSDGYFNITTMFKTSGSKEPGLYVLDCIFSVLIVGTLVVISWRGLWVILDITLYPDEKPFSAWGSLIIGYGIVIVTFLLQPIMKSICDRITGYYRLVVADIFLFLSFVGTVNVWRGIWMLLDLYFISENHVLSCWVTHSAGFILLAILNCSNSVLVRGVYIDCEEGNGKSVIFPIHYIRLFFKKERIYKQEKDLLNSLENQQTPQTLLLNKEYLSHNNIHIIPQQKSNKNNNMHSLQQNNVIIDEIKPMLRTQIKKTDNQINNNDNHKNNETKTNGDYLKVNDAN